MDQQDQQLRDLIGKAAQDPEFYQGAIGAMEKGLSEYLSQNGFDLSPQQIAQLVRMDHSNIEGALSKLAGGTVSAA